MRGSAITARRPAASTVPSTELSASLLTTSGAGRCAARHRDHLVEQPRRARRASVRRLDESLDDQRQGDDRTDEQRPDRPAGGLYDRKQYGPFLRPHGVTPRTASRADYGVRLGSRSQRARPTSCAVAAGCRSASCTSSTAAVDNFVDNLAVPRARHQQRRAAGQIAEELSRKKSFDINDLLRQRLRPARASRGLEASSGAAVELSGRASRCVCRWLSARDAPLAELASGASAR